MLTAKDAAFDVLQAGAGRDLVLFHSLLTDRTVFDGVVLALARRHRHTLVTPRLGRLLAGARRLWSRRDRSAMGYRKLRPDFST